MNGAYLKKVNLALLLFIASVHILIAQSNTRTTLDSLTDSLKIAPPKQRALIEIEIGDYWYRKYNYNGYANALNHYNAALEYAEANKNPLYIAFAHKSLGAVYDALQNDQNDLNAALFHYYFFLHYAESIKDTPMLSRAYINIISILDKKKDTNALVLCVDSLHRIIRHSKNVDVRNHVLIEAANALVSLNKFSPATTIFSEIDTTHPITNSTLPYRMHFVLCKAGILSWQKKYTDALSTLNKELSITTSAHDSLQIVVYLERLYVNMGDYKKAYEMVTKNQSLFYSMNYGTPMKNLGDELLKTKIALEENEKKSLQLEKNQSENIVVLLIVVIASFVVVLLILARTYLRKKASSALLTETNATLEKRNTEYEILLKEVNHRVKNNLQMVSSLLELQQYKTKDTEVNRVLNEAKSKIISIALLHQNLYSNNLNYVELQTYFPQLLDYLINNIASASSHIATHFDIEPIELAGDKLMPLALIINEWVINTIKHATVDNAAPEIHLRIVKHNTDLLVTYSDNGPGLSSEPASPSSLGNRLVNMLANQLKARLSIENEPGRLAYHLKFSI